MIANEHIKIGNNSYEKVKTFKHLGALVTNQNSFEEEITTDLMQEIFQLLFSPNTFVLSTSL